MSNPDGIAGEATAEGGSVDAAGESRTANNTMRHQYRVLGDAEKRLMLALKDTGVEFLDLLAEVSRSNANAGRATAIARTKMEEAVMWAVKGLTE